MSDYPKKQCTECGDWYEREAFFSKDPNSGIRISICNGCELKIISRNSLNGFSVSDEAEAKPIDRT
jgi:hypothetical protein